ncbi:MAG: hypothetical protein KBA61_08095 [Spirochaetes bacterium]|nr:hypothetical protein [Spirochaetota bacterium]HPA74167.1 hypothetical protein [Spirochaetota bacterium]
MNVTNGTQDIIESIERLNQMLFIFSGAGRGIEEKMMKAAATQKIEGLGDAVDAYC